MYVCLCNAVKDSEIREAVEQGLTSLEDVSEELGVATGCGCCRELAESLIQEHSQASALGYAA